MKKRQVPVEPELSLPTSTIESSPEREQQPRKRNRGILQQSIPQSEPDSERESEPEREREPEIEPERQSEPEVEDVQENLPVLSKCTIAFFHKPENVHQMPFDTFFSLVSPK